MKSSCTYSSPLWFKATLISSQVLTVLPFPPRSASFHSHGLCRNYLKYNARSSNAGSAWWARQISVWGEPSRRTQRGEKIFVFCCRSSFESSLMWFILPPVQPSSLAIPLQHRAPHKRQMCSHGNRPVMPLLVCQIKSTSAERNQLVTRLISHQHDGATSESRAAFWLREHRLSLLDTHTHTPHGIFMLSLFLPWPFFGFITFYPSAGWSFNNVQHTSGWWQLKRRRC